MVTDLRSDLISAVQNVLHSVNSVSTATHRSLRLINGTLSSPPSLSAFALNSMSYLLSNLLRCTAATSLESYGVAIG